MLSPLTVLFDELGERCLQIRLTSSIQRISQDRSFSAARQAESGAQGHIHAQASRGMGHGFDASQQAHKEHFQLLEGQVLCAGAGQRLELVSIW